MQYTFSISCINLYCLCLAGCGNGTATTITSGGRGGNSYLGGPGGSSRFNEGEWLVDSILRYGSPSLNDFERKAADEPGLRRIIFKQNYQQLSRTALALAKHKVHDMPFIALAQKAYQEETAHMRYSQCLSIQESFEWYQRILEYNDIDMYDFSHFIFQIMDKKLTKINTVILKGPPNAGKTLIAESIAKAAIFYCNIQKFSKGQNFVFMDAVGVRCCMINEPRFTDEWVESLKNIFEGCPVHVDVKFLSGQMLERTPVVITTNHPLSMYVQNGKDIAQSAFDARSKTFLFSQFQDLKDCKGHLHPGLWYLVGKELLREGVSVDTYEDMHISDIE